MPCSSAMVIYLDEARSIRPPLSFARAIPAGRANSMLAWVNELETGSRLKERSLGSVQFVRAVLFKGRLLMSRPRSFITVIECQGFI